MTAKNIIVNPDISDADLEELCESLADEDTGEIGACFAIYDRRVALACDEYCKYRFIEDDNGDFELMTTSSHGIYDHNDWAYLRYEAEGWEYRGATPSAAEALAYANELIEERPADSTDERDEWTEVQIFMMAYDEDNHVIYDGYERLTR